MSTKVTMKWRAQSVSQPGFQLYEDVLDSLGDDVDRDDVPVYLRLDGVTLDLHTLPGGGASVTVALPRELARELGLLQPLPRPGPSQDPAGPAGDLNRGCPT
jgi:hypothetical protein